MSLIKNLSNKIMNNSTNITAPGNNTRNFGPPWFGTSPQSLSMYLLWILGSILLILTLVLVSFAIVKLTAPKVKETGIPYNKIEITVDEEIPRQ